MIQPVCLSVLTALGIFILGAPNLAAQQKPETYAGVENTQRAWQHWVLNCQGCHGPDASGHLNATPNMAGEVARFLSVPGGREYLGRVPGVSTSPLSDKDLAELMNWMLPRFDAKHIPENFTPYTAAEVRKLRAKPLRTEANNTRTRLMALMPALKP